MIKLIDLSKNKVKGLKTIEATFMVDGELIPLRVSEEDRPETYNEISQLLKKPDLDIDEIQEQIYSLMSPVANVRKHIESSFYLSDNLSIEGGVIKFGDYVLEKTLSDHILSLLDEENVPKDEKLWKSYITFLDNLHQNVNEDIRKQLFRWMDYENKAGVGFGITEDGCIVGYKGCEGTVLEPVSIFSGTAIVDGVEITGKIPNKVGSVISMPRSAVQYDPEVGCSVGLHVGTRDYAINWAPILLLVKVNPRDVVSVPYECDSQKMRVCKYTVLKVTDASEEHKMYHPEENEYEDDFEYDYDYDEDDFELDVDTALDLIDEEIYIEYDSGDKAFSGTVCDVYEDGYNSGVVVRSNDGEYKHIKLNRITYYNVELPELEADEDEEQQEVDWSVLKSELSKLIEKKVTVSYDEKKVSGVLTSIYDNEKSPGLIIKTDNDGVKHIKLERINSVEVINDPDAVREGINDFYESLKKLIEETLK